MKNLQIDIFNYLDALRDSGTINMYEAPEKVRKRYNITEEDAASMVEEWMATYSEHKTVTVSMEEIMEKILAKKNRESGRA